MKITLTKQEAEKFFYSALCNGLTQISYYDLELTCNPDHYNKAKTMLQKTEYTVCYEDVYMEILKTGGKLKMIDHTNGEKPRLISMEDVHNRMNDVPARHLLDMAEEKGDSQTADAILQTVFYGDIIFG